MQINGEMRLKDVRFVVMDTETTGLDPKKDQLVEIGFGVKYLDKPIKTWSTLVNPGIPIPPEASAIHHIVNKDVKDMMLYPGHISAIKMTCRDGIIVAHNAPFDKSFLPCLSENRWICTIRLAKKIWPGLPSYKNQALRYRLGIEEGLMGPIHRVSADIYVTGEIFQQILEKYLEEHMEDGDDSLETFLLWSSKRTKLKIMPFGKHKDRAFVKIPLSYLLWAKQNLVKMDEDLKYTIDAEIIKRQRRK